MKKYYTTPTIEKIAFRYRDQVVAASGVASQGEVNGSELSALNVTCGGRVDEIIDKLTEGALDFIICR